VPDPQGLTLSFAPSAKVTQGNPPTHRRFVEFQGWDVSLGLKWRLDLGSRGESWSGTAWGGAKLLPTAMAVSEVVQAGRRADILVEPFLGDAWAVFKGRPVPGLDLTLKDVKGITHSDLALSLGGCQLIPRIGP
jgi:hypothetical protein